MEKRDQKTRFLMAAVPVACAVMICLSGCSGEQPVVKAGDRVKVHYSASLPGGDPFESNRNGTPLEFTVGSGTAVKGFNNAVIGMKPGETRVVTLSPEDAYGPYNQSLVNTLDNESVIKTLVQLYQTGNLDFVNISGTEVIIWRTEDNTTGYIRLTNQTSQTITVDENHPLAGKDIVFEITVVEIVPGQ